MDYTVSYENSRSQLIFYEQKYVKTHFHYHVELKFVLKGSIATVIDGKQFTVREGMGLIVFPYKPHSYRPIDDGQICIAQIHPEQNQKYFSLFRQKIPLENVFDIGSIDNSMFGLIEMMRQVHLSQSQLSSEICGGYIDILCGTILERLSMTDIGKSIRLDTLDQIVKWCNEHYREPINVKSASRALFVSERQISRLFSEKLRTSFRSYINSLRIQLAAELLTSTSKQVGEIAYECGYDNLCTFNRVFLEITALTPSEVRARGRRL